MNARFYRPALAVLIAAGLFLGVSFLVLSRLTARVYGFEIAQDLGAVVEVALQVCPLFAALGLILLAPLRDRITERVTARWPSHEDSARVFAIVAVSLAAAIVFLGLTIAAVFMVASGLPVWSDVYLSPRIWLSLLFDLVLIAVFTHFVYLLTRRPVISVLIFFAYIVVVVVIGPKLGVTDYIGFGTTPRIVLTAYDPMPVNFEAAWIWRAYWLLVTTCFLALIFDFGAPRGRFTFVRTRVRTRRFLPPGTLAVASAAAAGLAVFLVSGLRTAATNSYAGTHTIVPAGAAVTGQTRPTLQSFALDLKYIPERRFVGVRGNIALINDRSDAPLRSVLLEKSPLLQLAQVTADRRVKIETDRSGRLVALTFDVPLERGTGATVNFSGSISAANTFDHVARALLLSRAFFLTSAHLLPMPRSPECFDAPGHPAELARCDAGENYLLTDGARGHVSVSVPRGLRVASIGEATVTSTGSTSRFDVAIDGTRLTNFFVACAAFASATTPAASGLPAVTVYGATEDGPRLPDIARTAQRTLDDYQASWPRYRYDRLYIVEVPATLNEATAYAGAVAINEKLLRTRAVGSVEGSGVTRLVIAHELAHQWWGYALVPARAPGRLFVLESFPQFAAYAVLDRQGILPRDTALRREQKRYERARARSGMRNRPLNQIEREDWLAYHKGPVVLLQLDRASNHVVMKALGQLLAAHASGPSRVAAPGPLIDSLIERLPADERETARALLTR